MGTNNGCVDLLNDVPKDQCVNPKLTGGPWEVAKPKLMGDPWEVVKPELMDDYSNPALAT